jgi:hypothetical protein
MKAPETTFPVGSVLQFRINDAILTCGTPLFSALATKHLYAHVRRRLSGVRGLERAHDDAVEPDRRPL